MRKPPQVSRLQVIIGVKRINIIAKEIMSNNFLITAIDLIQ